MKPYAIKPGYDGYVVLNPSGVEIALAKTWRVARDIADLYNDRVQWKRWAKEELLSIAQLRASYDTEAPREGQ